MHYSLCQSKKTNLYVLIAEKLNENSVFLGICKILFVSIPFIACVLLFIFWDIFELFLFTQSLHLMVAHTYHKLEMKTLIPSTGLRSFKTCENH